MSDSSDLPIAALRRLARGLVYDQARADDVVQDAWLAALRRSPPPEGLRAWLAEAVRRLARASGRDELRRAARERHAARPEVLPSAAETSARIELLRRLLDAVDALEEPYRSAVVLRYFEELPPRAIARRLGIPVNTARTHVRRGLERLRRQLDGRGQGREELLAALVPLAGARPWSATLGVPTPLRVALETGGLVMKGKVWTAALVLLVAGAFWLRRGDSPREADAGPNAVASDVAGSSTATEGEVAAPSETHAGAREPLGATPPAGTDAWTVRGHVFKGRREAYAHARLVGRVWAGPRAEGTPLVDEIFHADERGDFAWSIAPPAEPVAVRVEPVREGQLTTSAFDTFRPGDPPPERWIVNAFPLDGRLRGVVRDLHGEPVPGARVVHERFDGVKEVRADGEGRFELRTSSHLGWIELTVIAKGFAVVSTTLEDLQPGDQTRDVALAPELRLRGRVVDEGGAAVADALVSATFPSVLAGVRTGADGSFELGGVAPGAQGFAGQTVLAVEKAGFLELRHGVIPGVDVVLPLARGVPLSGRVLAPDLTPVAGAWVSVGYGVHPRNDAFTDEQGRFELAPTFPGPNELWLWRRGFAQRRHDVEVPEDAERVDGIEIVLERPHFLGGVVLDERGAPVPWAWVYVEDPEFRDPHVQDFSTHADAAGRFLLEGLPDVPMRLCVREEGHALLEQDVRALDRDDLVLRLSGPVGLAGLVLNDATGAPVPAFTVRIARSDDPEARASLGDAGRSFTDPAGTWRTDEALPIGKGFTIEVRAPGFAARTAQVVTSAKRDPTACVVRLLAGGHVRGRVVERATQQPVEGARVQRSSRRDYGLDLTPREALTDARGEFELADLPPGLQVLRVEASAGGAVDGPFELRAGETVERWIELGSGGRISGRLLDVAGLPLAGATVELFGNEVAGSTNSWLATTAADGGFEFAALPAGIFELFWLRELAGQRTRDLQVLVRLAGGEERRIDLQPRGGATLRGTVARTGAATPEVVSLFLHRPSPRNDGFPDGMRGTLARNGTFEVPGLEAGKWTVKASWQTPEGESISATESIEIPAEGVVETQLELAPRR